MTKLLFYFAATLLLASCQKQNYISSIPAPKFEYQTTTSKPAVLPNVEARTADESPSELPISHTINGHLSTEIVESLPPSPTSVAKKETKMPLKQRIIVQVVERKIRRASSLQSTSPKIRKTDGVSVASFIAAVLGIVGLVATGWLFLLGMIGAVVMGFIGLSRIKHSNGQLGGRGWAISGLVLGFLELLLLILGVLFIAALISSFGA
jgi:hypothetical protein